MTDGLVKKNGIFSFSYASYKVNLEPLGYTERRKEGDFQNLRKYLCKYYSNQYIPPLILTSKKLTEASIRRKEKYFTMEKFFTGLRKKASPFSATGFAASPRMQNMFGIRGNHSMGQMPPSLISSLAKPPMEKFGASIITLQPTEKRFGGKTSAYISPMLPPCN